MDCQSPCPSSSSPTPSSSLNKKRSNKSHVPTACANCKKAHLACDPSRPCKRCVSMNKTETCYDIQHKKRGRPKLRDKHAVKPSNSSTRTTPPSSVFAFSTALRTSSAGTVVIGQTLAPGLANSSFIMTQPPNYQQPAAGLETSMMTIFLSMDMRCARVSDEALEFLGMYPQELAHRSLYDFIAPHQMQLLHHIHQCLSSVTERKTGITTTDERFVTMAPSLLLNIANGSQTFKEKLCFKRCAGAGPTEEEDLALDARFYLGGGLGADLFVPDTLDKLYIVCLLSKAGEELGQRSSTALQQQELYSHCSTSTTLTSLAYEQPSAVKSLELLDNSPYMPLASTPRNPSIELTLAPSSTANSSATSINLWTPSPSSSSMSSQSTISEPLVQATTSFSESEALYPWDNTIDNNSNNVTSEEDVSHRLVWMHPHDMVYPTFPKRQQQTLSPSSSPAFSATSPSSSSFSSSSLPATSSTLSPVSSSSSVDVATPHPGMLVSSSSVFMLPASTMLT